MNTALWQVGWGYFLSNMIGAEAGLTQPDLEWARRHYLDHVRSFGPFPTLRCGAQPYGLLPVTSLDLWQPGTGDGTTAQDAWLKGMLISLRDNVWRPALASVARIGNRQNPIDPDADLADVMRTDAIPSWYRTRNVFGSHFLQHLCRFLASGMADSDPAQIALLQQLGIAVAAAALAAVECGLAMERPRAARAGRRSVAVGQARAELHRDAPRRAAHRTADPRAARSAAADDTTSLLQTLLRHALLREIASAAARLQAADTGADLSALLRDAELVDLVTGARDRQCTGSGSSNRSPRVAGGRTIREFLETQTSFTTPALAALGEFRSSLAHLKDLDSEALSQLMQGTLDLSAHRLDAWITSVATKRLAAMHIDGPAGQYIGAYGWVENLKPIPASFVKPVPALPAGEPAPLQTAANDSGFIHAPSMTHAATAALLRNAHLGPTGVAEAGRSVRRRVVLASCS